MYKDDFPHRGRRPRIGPRIFKDWPESNALVPRCLGLLWLAAAGSGACGGSNADGSLLQQTPTHAAADAEPPLAPSFGTEVGPNHWGERRALLQPAPSSLDAEAILAPMGERCVSSGGQWQGLWVACHCPKGRLFAAAVGCILAPPILASTAGCDGDWLHCPNRCLRALQAGPLAWRLRFTGRRSWVADLRRALAEGDWPSLLAVGIALPQDEAISLHFTQHLGALRADDLVPPQNDMVLWPPHYNALAVFPSPSHRRNPSVAMCRRYVITDGRVGPVDADMLCTAFAAAYTQLVAAPHSNGTQGPRAAPGWPAASTQVWVAQEDGPEGGRVLMLQRRWPATPEGATEQPDTAAPVSWRIHMRDGAVLARTLTVAPADAPIAGYGLTALFDATGSVQALVLQPSEAPLAEALVVMGSKS